ncbi:MAG: WhiB family transcriptional regulator [Candidatus Saccharibacteria bacterium]|nr:WhiB family transcriptional regulator [Candidatus Saccharibacteria bacterium]
MSKFESFTPPRHRDLIVDITERLDQPNNCINGNFEINKNYQPETTKISEATKTQPEIVEIIPSPTIVDCNHLPKMKVRLKNRKIAVVSKKPTPIKKDWHQDAACRGLIDLFYKEYPTKEDTTKVKDLCCRCPVVSSCLETGLTANRGIPEKFGIWAGFNSRELSKIHRARQADRKFS